LVYLTSTWANAVSLVRQNPLPDNIPVIDIVAEISIFSKVDWIGCHEQFAKVHATTETIMAKGCSHYVFKDNPSLVNYAIAKAYGNNLKKKEKAAILTRHFELSQEILNQNSVGLSEREINTWGYQLLSKGEISKAVEVFKLNVNLYPESWNTYDSYAAALLKNGQEEESKKMKQKSIELRNNN
jgi:tetratricopeptide (TPR) repeat protein